MAEESSGLGAAKQQLEEKLKKLEGNDDQLQERVPTAVSSQTAVGICPDRFKPSNNREELNYPCDGCGQSRFAMQVLRTFQSFPPTSSPSRQEWEAEFSKFGSISSHSVVPQTVLKEVTPAAIRAFFKERLSIPPDSPEATPAKIQEHWADFEKFYSERLLQACEGASSPAMALQFSNAFQTDVLGGRSLPEAIQQAKERFEALERGWKTAEAAEKPGGQKSVPSHLLDRNPPLTVQELLAPLIAGGEAKVLNEFRTKPGSVSLNDNPLDLAGLDKKTLPSSDKLVLKRASFSGADNTLKIEIKGKQPQVFMFRLEESVLPPGSIADKLNKATAEQRNRHAKFMTEAPEGAVATSVECKPDGSATFVAEVAGKAGRKVRIVKKIDASNKTVEYVSQAFQEDNPIAEPKNLLIKSSSVKESWMDSVMGDVMNKAYVRGRQCVLCEWVQADYTLTQRIDLAQSQKLPELFVGKQFADLDSRQAAKIWMETQWLPDVLKNLKERIAKAKQ
jgi:hypothetical protein